MENKTNNIFVAFALWAGAWALLGFFDTWSYELQRALDGLPVHAPFGLDDLPMLGGFLAVMIASRIWKASIMSLLFTFAVFELIKTALGFAASSSYYLLCSPNVCTGAWSHDFGVRSLAFDGIGYMAASIVVHAVRLTSGTAEYRGSRNPLAYAAHLIAGMARGLGKLLQVDVGGIKALWKKWAALPLWPSGRIIAGVIRPFWVPYFGLAAAIVLAAQIAQFFGPFLQSGAPFFDAGPEWNLIAAGVVVGIACKFIASWAAGRMTAELGWKVSPIAAAIAVFFTLHWQIIWLVGDVFMGRDPSNFYILLVQTLGEIAALYLGYRIGYRRAAKQRQAIAPAAENTTV